MQGSDIRRMPCFDDNFPLLRLTESHFPSPGRDGEFSDGLPFPMLQMVDPHRGQVPFFVAPENIIGHNNNNRKARTMRSAMPTARSEPPTGRSDIPSSSRQSIELLQVHCSSSEHEDMSETDYRQVSDKLVSGFGRRLFGDGTCIFGYWSPKNWGPKNYLFLMN